MGERRERLNTPFDQSRVLQPCPLKVETRQMPPLAQTLTFSFPFCFVLAKSWGMFAKLTGLVDDLAEDHLVLDVGGVGYLVAATRRTLDALHTGDAISLRIETMVGEDHIRLFGFRDGQEQRWFRLLQSVQGVGSRVALAILSVLPPDRLAPAIAAQDKASVAQANGVGKKLAERIVTELKDKAALESSGTSSLSVGHVSVGNEKLPAASADAISALMNLGYKPLDAQAAVQQALAKSGADLDVGALIRAALKEAAGKLVR
jgi:holliday junction DNA helicase RuvA